MPRLFESWHFLCPRLNYLHQLTFMKKHQLWPLLPPLVVTLAIISFLSLNRWMKTYGFECGIHKATGIHCPGCGGTRCAQSIIKGDWSAAMGYNAMLMTGLALITTLFTFLIIRVTILGKPAPKIPHIKTRWIWIAVSGILLFTILRNIPSYPWSILAP